MCYLICYRYKFICKIISLQVLFNAARVYGNVQLEQLFANFKITYKKPEEPEDTVKQRNCNYCYQPVFMLEKVPWIKRKNLPKTFTTKYVRKIKKKIIKKRIGICIFFLSWKKFYRKNKYHSIFLLACKANWILREKIHNFDIGYLPQA